MIRPVVWISLALILALIGVLLLFRKIGEESPPAKPYKAAPSTETGGALTSRASVRWGRAVPPPADENSSLVPLEELAGPQAAELPVPAKLILQKAIRCAEVIEIQRRTGGRYSRTDVFLGGLQARLFLDDFALASYETELLDCNQAEKALTNMLAHIRQASIEELQQRHPETR